MLTAFPLLYRVYTSRFHHVSVIEFIDSIQQYGRAYLQEEVQEAWDRYMETGEHEVFTEAIRKITSPEALEDAIMRVLEDFER